MPAAPSPRLAAFLAESPFDRPAIHSFLSELASALPEGTRVLDAGAGAAPYRGLFAHCAYMTSDWEESEHPEAHRSDVVAPLGELPLPDASLDVVVNTQVLEHVADPLAVLADFRRVLRPGGELWLTAPFVWELHEEPHDYFRYTSYGLRAVLARAGFTVTSITPLGGYFDTIAQLLRHAGSITGLDRGGLLARICVAVVARLVPLLTVLDRFDRRRALPLGWCVRAIAGDPTA